MADITGSRAVTNAVISPNVELQIGSFTIGYARRATETQSRPVNPIYEVGTVGIIEMVPGQPAPVTLALEHVAIYGATLVGIIAKAIASGNLAGVSAAAGLSLDDTKTALQIWIQKRLGAGRTIADITSIADMPVGFQCQLNEQHPLDDTKLFITTYQNCWITRYSRPVVATGDLLTIEAMDITAQRVTTKEGIPVTSDKVEIVTKNS
jgi:hypothetical protein